MTRPVAVAELTPEPSASPPRPRSRGRRAWRPRATPLLLAATVAVAGIGALADGRAGGVDTTTLEVYAHGEGEVAYARDLEVGDTFRLEHTHSVTRRPVVEIFSVQDVSTIAVEELRFDEPGPNLPAGPEPLGDGMTTFLHEDGAFRVLHHGHEIGTLPLMVGGPDVDHQVVFADGQRVRLLDVVRRGERVELMAGRGDDERGGSRP